MNRSSKRTTVVCFSNRDLKEWEVLVGNFFFFFVEQELHEYLFHFWFEILCNSLQGNMKVILNIRIMRHGTWAISSGKKVAQIWKVSTYVLDLQSSEASAFPNDITRASIINQYNINDNLRVSLQDQARSWVLKRWYSRLFQVVRKAIISCTQNIMIIINHVNKIQSDYYSSWNRRSWYFWLKWDN